MFKKIAIFSLLFLFITSCTTEKYEEISVSQNSDMKISETIIQENYEKTTTEAASALNDFLKAYEKELREKGFEEEIIRQALELKKTEYLEQMQAE